MTLSQGRPYLAIPGPSVMPDAVLRAMHRAAPNIYAGEIVEMTESLVADLAGVARTAGKAAIYIANGHGAWEAALANVIAPGDKVVTLATGRFGHGWGEMASALGARVDVLDFGRRAPVDPARIEELLRADKGHEIKAVLATHVDTATSVRNDMTQIRRALDAAGHPALVMADCIASMGCDRFEMDDWGVDVAVAASQKGFMTPPGLGFVFFNAKAAQVRAAMPRVSRYWDWGPRTAPELFYEYFNGTAPTHHLYGLRAALDMIAEEGLEAVWARHERLARVIWAACEAWGQGGPLRLNITEAASRSRAVTSVGLTSPDGTRLRQWVEAKAGLTLGLGLGMADESDPRGDGYFRIGHMGHVNAHMILGVLGTIQSGLEALDIPYGDGALDAASKVISAA